MEWVEREATPDLGLKAEGGRGGGMEVSRNGWQWKKGWLGLISRQTNWEEKGPHMLCLTSLPAGEKAGVGEGCVSVYVEVRGEVSCSRIPKVKEP